MDLVFVGNLFELRLGGRFEINPSQTFVLASRKHTCSASSISYIIKVQTMPRTIKHLTIGLSVIFVLAIVFGSGLFIGAGKTSIADGAVVSPIDVDLTAFWKA